MSHGLLKEREVIQDNIPELDKVHKKEIIELTLIVLS